MAIYYKFKSERNYKSIAMDGPFMSVGILKKKIFECERLGRGTGCDILVTNAQTNEEIATEIVKLHSIVCETSDYLDEAMMVPANTSVLIRRVPIPKVEEAAQNIEPEKKSFTESCFFTRKYGDDFDPDDFSAGLYEIPDATQWLSSNVIPDAPSTNTTDKDNEIKSLTDTLALDLRPQGPDGYGPRRGFSGRLGDRVTRGRGFDLERRVPPHNYVCHRCRVPRHFIQHCPTNGDPTFDIRRVKAPGRIPELMPMEPDETAFEKEMKALPTMRRPVRNLVDELRCPLCRSVMKYAVLTSTCCFRSFCDKCIRDYFISSSMCVCGATNVVPDDLSPNQTVRDTITRILESGSSSENAGSTFLVQEVQRKQAAVDPGKKKIPVPANTNVPSVLPGESYMIPPPIRKTFPSRYNNPSMGGMEMQPRPPKRKSDHDYNYRHHNQETSDHQHHYRRSPESSERPSSESSRKVTPSSTPGLGSLDGKHKASVLAPISSSSSAADGVTPGGDASESAHHKSNREFRDQKSTSAKVPSSLVSRGLVDKESSSDEDDCHFKRRRWR